MTNFTGGSDVTMTLPLFCCIEKQLATVGEIQNLGQILTLTSSCFKGMSVSQRGQLKLILELANASNTYTKAQCEQLRISRLCTTSTKPEFMLFFAFWLLVFLIAAFGNSIVLYAVYRSRQLRSTYTNYFIASLAVSDLLVSIVIVPVKLKFTYNNLYFCASESMCRLYQTVDPIFFAASITNLFIISVDRFTALICPYAYPTLLTAHRARIIIACAWAYAVVWGGLVNLKWDDTSKNSIYRTTELECVVNNRIYTTVLFGFVFYVPAIMMAFIYYRIFLIARHHAKHIASTEKALQSNPPSCISQNNNFEESMVATQMTPMNSIPNSIANSAEQSPMMVVKSTPQGTQPRVSLKTSASSKSLSKRMIFRVTKTVATVYGLFLICWLPVSIISLLRSWCHDCLHHSSAWKWLHIVFIDILPVFNSVCNPFIYAIMNKTYRTAFLNIWKDICRKIPHIDLTRNYDCAKTVVSTSL